MKRAWKISDAAKLALLLGLYPRSCSVPRTQTLFSFIPNTSQAHCSIRGPSTQPLTPTGLIRAFVDNARGPGAGLSRREDVVKEVSILKEDLLRINGDWGKVVEVLDEKGGWLIRRSDRGAALTELLRQLRSWPRLSLEIFTWRRKMAECGFAMTSEEYAKGITVSGRLKNIELAQHLFKECVDKGLKDSSTFHALMGAYMWNGLMLQCVSLFKKFTKDQTYSASVVPYNILISLYGRLMMVDKMEAVFHELKDLNLAPNLSTFNSLISGYVTAWEWGKMESMFEMMKAGLVKPDVNTYLLILRGYANSGNLVRMEAVYKCVRSYVNKKEYSLVRAMICAYSRSSSNNRLEKIDNLVRLIPDKEFTPSLNLLLIRVYAEEDLLEEMESLVKKALERQTYIVTSGVLNSITASYFRCNAVDKLAEFTKLAEAAGWRITRSMCHCRMILYASQKRLAEMEIVLGEMENHNVRRIRRTFFILFMAYSMHGERHKADQVTGMMLKHGYRIPTTVVHLGPCKNFN